MPKLESVVERFLTSRKEKLKHPASTKNTRKGVDLGPPNFGEKAAIRVALVLLLEISQRIDKSEDALCQLLAYLNDFADIALGRKSCHTILGDVAVVVKAVQRWPVFERAKNALIAKSFALALLRACQSDEVPKLVKLKCFRAAETLLPSAGEPSELINVIFDLLGKSNEQFEQRAGSQDQKNDKRHLVNKAR